jgi:hypothetical protein
VPIGGLGSQKVSPFLQGTTGVNAGKPVLNALAFGPPISLPPDTAMGAGNSPVPPCDPGSPAVCDNFENPYNTNTGRNIFRGPFQSRFDFGVFKNIKLTERFRLKYEAQFFNIFNHPSFDTPNNNVSFNPGFPFLPTFPVAMSCGPSTFPGQGAFQCPPGGKLGVIQHTIGSPRFIQMALHLTF